MVFEIFFKHNIINSLIGLLVFFVVFQFFYLDIYLKDNKKTTLSILIITLIEIIALNFFWNWIMIIGLIVMNWTIFYLSTILEKTANESIKFKETDYFLAGGYIFTLGLTIAYSFFIIGVYNKFPFSCDDLNKNAWKVVEAVLNPLHISWLKIEDTWEPTKEIKVNDLLSIGKIINIESDVWKITPLENFKLRKNELITKTLAENKELNQGVCEYSLNKLEMKMKNTDFQIGVIMLMTAISYPFLRIAIRIMSWVCMILFRILQKCKWYSVEKMMVEIEKIK